MDDTYAGKTDRELLVEIYTEMKNACGIMESHEAQLIVLRDRQDEVVRWQNRIIGSLAIIGMFAGALIAKIMGWLS
jgi:hypothetical protein